MQATRRLVPIAIASLGSVRSAYGQDEASGELSDAILQRLNEWLQPALGLGAVIVVAIVCQRLARIAIRWSIPWLVKWAGTHQQAYWVEALSKHFVARRSANAISALVASGIVPIALSNHPRLASAVSTILNGYLVVVTTVAFNTLLGTVGDVFAKGREQRYRLSIQVATQAAQGVSAVVGIIILLGVIFHQSPVVLLSGFAGMTALMMLLFRDSIMGFVAGIQLSMNDMLRIGDWIEVPQFGANGSVMDVRLTTVKVQNFDKTITTVPTHALVSESFKNWRGMYDSGSRRIRRSIAIDMTSVGFLEAEQVDELRRVRLISEYLDKTAVAIQQYNEQFSSEDRRPPNTRQLTNLGTFRVYLEKYLDAHPALDEDMVILVRHLPPSQNGLPIEIYAFSREQEWEAYERIQSEIFDHILSVLPLFGLSVLQLGWGEGSG